MVVVNTKDGLLLEIGDVVAGSLAAAKVGLFTGAPVISPSTVIADFTEPLFTGYLRKSITWSAPFYNGNQQEQVDSGLMQWQPTDGVNPSVVTGFFVINTAGTKLLFAGLFDAPVSMIDATSALPLVVQYLLGP